MEAVSNFFSNSEDHSDSSNISSNKKKNVSESSSSKLQEPLKPLSQMANQLATEKLIEKLLYMSLPSSSSNGFLSSDGSLSDHESLMKANKNKPGLSIQIMSKNFINLNARLSLPFCTIDLIEEFFTWKNPFLTVSLTMVVSFLILNPNKILLVAPFLIYTQLVTPNFYQKYKPNEYLISQKNLFSSDQILPVTTIQPEKELSKEFILNITDLQNRMSLYVDVWNMVVDCINSYYLWQDETRTTIQTIVLFIGVIVTLMIPINFKFVLLVGFLSLISIQHPLIKGKVLAKMYSEDTRISLLSTTNSLTSKIANDIISPDKEKPMTLKTCTALLKQKKNGMLWETVVSLDDYSPPINYVFLKDSDWRLILEPSNGNLDDKNNMNESYDSWKYLGTNKTLRERTYARFITREVLLESSISKRTINQPKAEGLDNDYDGFIVL
ncbi:hypothetical protein QEN19_001153 [Hanseniaspora menglaensis]